MYFILYSYDDDDDDDYKRKKKPCCIVFYGMENKNDVYKFLIET